MHRTRAVFSVSLILQLTLFAAHAYYSPSSGRWLSRDPIGESGFEIARQKQTDSTRYQRPSGTSAARYPLPLSSKEDISSADRNAYAIIISKLPIEYYPLLRKFTKVKMIRFDSEESTLTTDGKLKVLAALHLTNITDISLTNCRLVTDSGIRSLTNIPSLKQLGLEGTAVTDDTCAVVASDMHLKGINVSNCDAITRKGVKLLTTSESLTEIGFSVNNMSVEDITNIVTAMKKATLCVIVDKQHRLDAAKLATRGSERGVQVIIRSTGAMQDTYGKHTP